MAEIKGSLIVCDRCNVSAFTMPGEYGSIEIPHDWHRVHFGTCLQDYNLCPECYEQFKIAKSNFFCEFARTNIGIIKGVVHGQKAVD